MALKPVVSILAACAMLDALTALFTSTCTLKIYSGAQPATTLTAEGGTLGATLTFSATAFPASTHSTADGLATATANAIASETNAPNSITAAHFICVNGSSVRVAQGNVGTSGCDLNLNTTTITAGDTVAITSLKITLPCGDATS